MPADGKDAYGARVRTHGDWRSHGRSGPPAGVLAVVVGGIEIAGTYAAAHNQPDRRAVDAWAALLLVVGAAALVGRLRYPAAVLAVITAATVGYYAAGYPNGPAFLALAVAMFTAVARGLRTVAWATLAVGFVVYVMLDRLLGGPSTSVATLAAQAAWVLAILIGAELARTRGERFAEMRRSRAEEARRRASEERLLLARELHDVLAHNVSLIHVQASTALHLFDADPERARTALAAIKDASHETLQELRATVGALRSNDDAVPRAPTPGLDRLDELVAASVSAGLRVQVRREGEPRPLPPRVDLAAYRVAQEALTNVRRHSGAASAEIRVAYGDELVLEVLDTGRGPSDRGGVGPGHGVQGMRERAAALGGTLEAGAAPGGGFRVRLRLPLAATS